MQTMEAQRALKALGYDPGPIDGVMGPLTRKAVRAFQADNGLEVDGVIGPRTSMALYRKRPREAVIDAPMPAPRVRPPWVVEMERRKGLHERTHHKTLWDWLKSAGGSVNPMTTPWCFTGDVEILTGDGWQRLDSLTAKEVYQVNDDGVMQLGPYKPVEREYDGEVIDVKHNRMKLTCDPDHRWWGERVSGRGRAVREMHFGPLDSFGCFGVTTTHPVKGGVGCGLSSREIALLAAFISDGCIHRGKLSFQVSKDRKIDALRGLAPENEYLAPQAYGPLSTKPLTTFTFSIPTWLDRAVSEGKILRPEFVHSMNADDARAFIRAYTVFDGNGDFNRTFLYTSEPETRDALTLIATFAGYNWTVAVKDGSNLTKKTCFEVRIGPNKTRKAIRPANTSRRSFSGVLYCVSTPLQRIIVRHPEGGHIVTGNCGDAVETAILRVLPDEPIPNNPMASINWLKFGAPLSHPTTGAILVFWRGSPKGWQGHVGFYVGEDASHYHVLGGNQSNAITVTRIAKNRLRKGGIRWPSTYPMPTTGRVMGDGSGLVVTENEA